MTSNESRLKIEKSFLKVINSFENSSCDLFIRGVTDPDIIRKGDLKEMGQSLQKMSDFLNSRIQDLEFQPSEHEDGKTKMRLERSITAINEMGKELETMDNEGFNDYHWYIVGMLTMIVASLFDHIEIHMDGH